MRSASSDGVDFQNAFENREIIEVDGLKIPFISKEDLIRNKLSTGREKDRLDAENLSGIRKSKTTAYNSQ